MIQFERQTRFGIFIASALLLPTPGALAQSGLGSTSDQATQIKFYGQLNLGLLSFDDGFDSETYFTDNDNSNSRLGIRSDTKLSNEDTFRLQLEASLGLNGSSSINADDDDFTNTWKRTEIRKLEAGYSSTTFGTISVGQGSMASDGIAEIDLSGTSVISYSSVADTGGGHSFRLTDGNPGLIKVGNVYSNFDGSRRTRIRYDTPKLSTLTISAGYGQETLKENDDNDYYDLALRYAGKSNQKEIRAGLGYGWLGDDDEVMSGSISILHESSGLNGTLAAGQDVNQEADYVYAKFGIISSWFNIGNTAISLDYYSGSDFVTSGSNSDTFAVSVVQHFDPIGLEVYGTYRQFEFEESEVDYEKSDSIMIGARWKF
ncbi:MAG: porin [bacterium]